MIGYLQDIVEISVVLKENRASIFIKQGFTHRLRKGIKQPVVKSPDNATGCLLGSVAPLIKVLK